MDQKWDFQVMISHISITCILPSMLPYSEDNGDLSLLRALEKILVTLVCMLLVDVLKFLQIWDMSREAKSLRAQWLSSSGLIQSCLETMHVVTDGISSCNCKTVNVYIANTMSKIITQMSPVYLCNFSTGSTNFYPSEEKRLTALSILPPK